ncbi:MULTISPECIES: murein biosynthesis integral membrane protein MurJ [unclassified Mycolicibacterium]|uniref:murein biosynthesis integral membrane protein MurJ n=2 Tax=Mycolicibacterium TaxID=1866885 RepID=UPI0012DBEB2A|nr:MULTISPECIES: murein biosynthesis integral membrane protein MurJ [unclassified Mycolicibacterium]MUL82931.1 murein biosynthesis integral membrane protein MurJ [Mycolicibacterium sp. CBMA 329]MUL89266.1 murein biosynthesis integral membrane protein MurJ [Mycolicibacterium sp. CBMA 331]MUM29712.1 murein biosynthesis integral membrane protein MurJ [Mycolicibacterium sp. CBMA 295]MUM38782.1 murein biosynthesis integral membrane protein MurJ [Mycolicibacterium sp. CBMA 247]MUM45330.1 murein bios
MTSPDQPVARPPGPPRIPHATGPARPAGRAELSDAAVVSRSWGMAFATLISRITGFFRFVLLMALLGGPLTSSFSVANQLPNMVAALVLEATFTAIFVPVLARAERDDADGGTDFVRRLVTLATTLLLITTVLSVLCAPLLVRLMLGSDPQVNNPLTTAFAYLLLPQVLFYGLSSVFMAILNTRNVFGPPAWAPVVNNVVAIVTLGVFVLVPGELSSDPVQMGTAKLLVLGIGTTLGVVAQAAVLFAAIREERVSLRPLWGIDDRLKKFGTMAAAMVLYVLISQIGLIVGNQIASTAAASGPAIYNYTWLVLMLPFGMIGVTVLTVVMPRLSRNAAADDVPAVLDDLSLATRLTMVTLIPIVAMMTVGGPAIGSALFAYGNFSATDAGYLGMAITLSAFTLIPYALVLLQLRVFYARERPWTPIVIIVVITTVKIIGSLAAPHLTDNPNMVAGYLGLANGLGFVAGAAVGYVLLKANLRPRGGRLLRAAVIRTILVTIAASLLASLVAHVADQLLGLDSLTKHAGAAGSLLRLLALGLIMVPIIAGVMLAARVPEAQSALAMIRRRLGRGRIASSPAAGKVAVQSIAPPVGPHPAVPVTYPDQRNSSANRWPSSPAAAAGGTPAGVAGAGMRKGLPVTDESADGPALNATSTSGMTTETTKLPRPAADGFQPDVAPAGPATPSDESAVSPTGAAEHTVSRSNGTARPANDYGGDPTREPISFVPPREAVLESAENDVHLIPGATIAEGRYRLLVFHGGPPHLQFWQALDTALDRQVALTFVDPDATMPDAQVQEILSRTLKLSRIDVPGIARVLDVAHSGSGGLIVSEWIRGGSLAEVADTSPSPIGGARAIQSLAAAAEAAHRAGVALSIDHPSRVRVSIEGDVALAFPATMPDATPDDDIRGIGAALYALLVNRWPLPESGTHSDLEPAALDQAGQPVEPRTMDRDIPFQISAAAARAVQPGGGIRSAPTLLNLLQQATAIADRTELMGSFEEAPAPVAPVRAHETPEEHEATEARRRKGLIIGVSVAAAIIIVALLVMASVLNRIFGDVGGGLNRDELGLNAPSSSEDTQGNSSAASGSTVKPVRATVFSPEGEADSPGQAGLAIDGNPGTAWSSDTYSDPAPFPGFKNGVGLMLQLPQPTVIGSVTINLTSTGTAVQIRAAQSATPSSLSDTTVLTPPTPLKPGANTISVNKASSTSYVLVWISTLGTVDGKSRTDISEITLKAAS